MKESITKSNNSIKKVEHIIFPIVEEKNLELVDIEFTKEGPNWYLRIYIDKEGGVTIDDCEQLSRAVEIKLDEYDPIEQAYILEISSPGIDRPLKKESDFIKYLGRMVDIKLYKPFEGSKEYQGELKFLKDNIITIIDDKNNELSFDRKDIAIVKLAVIF